MRQVLNHRNDDADKTNSSLSREESTTSSPSIANSSVLGKSSWETLWQEGLTPWDLGGPTKVLISELQSPLLHTHHKNEFRPRKSLIPGCGSGYDLISLARHVDEQQQQHNNNNTDDDDATQRKKVVIGMDISSTSLERARTVLTESMERDGPLQNTRINLYQGDFFAPPSTWNWNFGTETDDISTKTTTLEDDQQASFDFIFDYTFFCALPPALRQDYGTALTRLLKHDTGRLLSLMFPYSHQSKPNAKGPPYPVSLQDYREALSPQLVLGTQFPYASLDTVPKRQGQEVVGWWHYARK